jgi:hypothetical protein
LIDATSEPLAVRRLDTEEGRPVRPNSIGSGKGKRTSGNILNTPRSPNKERLAVTHARSPSLSVVPEYLQPVNGGPEGSEYIAGSRILIKAIRVPGEFEEKRPELHHHTPPRVLYHLPGTSNEGSPTELPRERTAHHLQILVTEDDPINSPEHFYGILTKLFLRCQSWID